MSKNSRKSKEPEKRICGAAAFPGFELLDIFGPQEMFGVLTEHFDIVMLGEDSAIEAAQRTEYEWHQDAAWNPFARPAGLG